MDSRGPYLVGWLALSAALALGCTAHRPAPPPSSAEGPASTATRRAPPLCDAAVRDQRIALQPYFDEMRRRWWTFDGRAFTRDRCWTDDHGAWTLSFSDVSVVPVPDDRDHQRETPEVRGRMQLVRLHTDGTRAASPPRPLVVAMPHLVDWDGDGVPELAMPTSDDDGELEIWTSGASDVSLYAPAKTLHARAIGDVDGDGRPDVVYSFPYDEGGPPPQPKPDGTLHVPWGWLVAHARPDGTFSIDDDVAMRAARESCPKEPIGGRASLSGFSRDFTLAEDVRCGRLAGRSQRELDAEIDRRCVGRSDCTTLARLRAWAAAPPPLKLR